MSNFLKKLMDKVEGVKILGEDKVVVPEDTIVLSREQMIADLGEEKVKDIEDTAEIMNAVSFSIFDKDGRLVRTYNEALHGEEAEKLARQFAVKINGKVE